jgi:hypothetical protein
MARARGRPLDVEAEWLQLHAARALGEAGKACNANALAARVGELMEPVQTRRTATTNNPVVERVMQEGLLESYKSAKVAGKPVHKLFRLTVRLRPCGAHASCADATDARAGGGGGGRGQGRRRLYKDVAETVGARVGAVRSCHACALVAACVFDVTRGCCPGAAGRRRGGGCG